MNWDIDKDKDEDKAKFLSFYPYLHLYPYPYPYPHNPFLVRSSFKRVCTYTFMNHEDSCW